MQKKQFVNYSLREMIDNYVRIRKELGFKNVNRL